MVVNILLDFKKLICSLFLVFAASSWEVVGTPLWGDGEVISVFMARPSPQWEGERTGMLT